MDALGECVTNLQRLEGCELVAYHCAADRPEVWTIGYGETLGVKRGDVWTREQAIERLYARAAAFLVGVYRRCPELHGMPESRAVGCCLLAYNIGLGAFGVSSVCRHTRRGEIDAGADSFLLWNKANGRTVRGLTVRRIFERGKYLYQLNG